MRWKLMLAVPVFLLVVQATSANAQNVPVTMTMEARKDKHPADSVKFYRSDNSYLDKVQEEPAQSHQQLVGIIPADGDGRYRLKTVLFIGRSGHDYTFSFGPVDLCTNSTASNKGKIQRIACSVVKYGAGMVCSAIYEGMGQPKDDCRSRKCVYCDRVRVCGSDPLCD